LTQQLERVAKFLCVRNWLCTPLTKVCVNTKSHLQVVFGIC
jgi:hypothetical protein